MYNAMGTQAYAKVGLESGAMSASPHQLIVMLFDGAHSALVRAALHIEAGQIPLKGLALSKAINIIDNGLKAGLDLDKGGEVAQNLSALYDYMVQRLLQANLHNDADTVRHVTELLDNIADAWRQIGPHAATTQQG
ncbi:flagellar export chaperone FliS [Edwardsiella piscicida]|uniref:flagellar export chaperone FliS n=1 Tax=Edwardsiella piscicida TaxID=1263550 RepID=UPI0002C0CBE3|nr:flagellar export chaperone FliS [Edwardsiella piscicida]AGH74145.1 Flagellar biosynthesis protein FliS [Edwardsiella piscicida C07-087]AOP43367.1 flagellar export chaperone FliS [Edwardsiella piscicida]EKS7765972.1 flagellar export chaperone FliS [Edwardsiella piscicida]EKS7780942.1 flagellar export chaperone FliS [Edwardsiella piscicida]EKS7783565.1 flagellar export chaperone FliS [Edwardsiella piscicida]